MIIQIALIAMLLSNYPSEFFNGTEFDTTIILSKEGDVFEDSSANTILEAIPKYRLPNPETQRYKDDTFTITPRQLLKKIKKDTEIEHITTKSIIIGTPCTNKWVNKLIYSLNCSNTIPENEAILKTMTVNNHPILIIAGNNGEMTLAAAKYLEDSQVKWTTDEIKIKKDKYVFAMQSNLEKATITTKTTPATGHEFKKTLKKRGTIYGPLKRQTIVTNYQE